MKLTWNFNPSSPPATFFTLVLINAQPRGKISPGTFKFILSPHFSEKNSNFPPPPGVGYSFQSWGVSWWGWCNPMILKLDYFENIWSDMQCTILCLQVRIVISNILNKKSHENRMFLRLRNFCIYFTCTPNDNFSIFEGVLTLWRHSEVLILVSMERGCPYLHTLVVNLGLYDLQFW